MDGMSPQQDSAGPQARSASLTGDCDAPGLAESRKKTKSLAQRRQSAPSTVISKALKSRTLSRENCFSPVCPETCPFLQSLTIPNRSFLMDGHVQLKTGLQTQERHLFLFTDILAIAKSKSSSHFKLKQQVRLCEMWTASCMEEVCEGSTNPERSFVIGWPTTNCVATFSSPEQKEKWLSTLLSRIAEEKENDQPKNLPLKIFAKDIGNGAHVKTLTVTNAETARDVIKTALEHFEVIGCEKDYQLWVISGKDDAPYPLIGHEHPYEIKMSHIRDATLQAQGAKKEDVFPLDLQGSDLSERVPGETSCQFILKPSRVTVCQPLNDLSQKPFKRRRSIINWAFWRGAGAQVDNTPASPTSVAPGRLFGLPLSDICENDNLLKPILNMLSFLYQEGPFTKGIFRRSASAKSCRELKDKLNSEADVHLDCESIFATASVFKDFLRNIPDSILSTKLCEKWVAVLEQENTEGRIGAIQRLMERLPRANLLLLRYLFGVLHIIEQHSQTNQMTAFNLAVCIAPSMLWLPTQSSPEVESDFTKKVSLFVQFLIEHCSKIFGEDITTLFGDLSARRDVREDGSDLCSFQLIDSSYDSLENELNDDADSALSNLATKRCPDNRSRDSVLTLSDCDLDQSEVEGIEIQLPPRSKPLGISTGLHHKSASQEHSENGSLCSNTSGYSSTTVSDALIGCRRHRRCSEPIIGLLESKLSQVSESQDSAARKTSCDAVMSHAEADYLKQLRSLQVEGKKLIDRSLTLGIDVNKGVDMRQSYEKKDLTHQLLPPAPIRLNIFLRTSCSSLSSPGTSPSGSSMSSLDSAFSHLSDYSAFTPNEISSPLDFPFRLQRKPVEASFEVTNSSSCSVTPVGTEVSASTKQVLGSKEPSPGKDNLEWPPQRSHGSLHPSSWLKSGASTMKNWSLRKKDKALKQEDRNHSSSKMPKSESQNGSYDATVNHVFKEEKLLSKLPTTMEIVNTSEQGESTSASSNQGIVLCNGPPSCEVKAKHQKRTIHKSVINHSIVDTNGNGLEDIEHNMPSSQSDLKNDVISLMDKHSQIPQTVFYGHNVSLFSPSKRQHFNMCAMEETSTLNVNIQRSPEPASLCSERCGPCTMDNRTFIGRDPSTRITSFKRNKVLPSNTNSDYKTPSVGIEKAFCVSPKPTNVAEIYFFRPDVNKCLQKNKDTAEGLVQNNGEWLKNCCSDNTYEETDKRFYTEESFV